MTSISAGCVPTPRGSAALDPATPWAVDVECLAPDALRARLHEFDVILRFCRVPMLHTLSVSPWHADIAAMLRVMDHGDDLLLLSDGVTAAIAGGRFL